jgi:hypothetical protein
MQETCLRLMGKKMLVALMMEGKFSGEGLQALDTDEDLMSAMARELVEKAGVGESADAVWRDLGHEREKVLPCPAVAELEPEEEFTAVLDLPVVIVRRAGAGAVRHPLARTGCGREKAQEAIALADGQ